jgi:hypothetical protein
MTDRLAICVPHERPTMRRLAPFLFPAIWAAALIVSCYLTARAMGAL